MKKRVLLTAFLAVTLSIPRVAWGQHRYANLQLEEFLEQEQSSPLADNVITPPYKETFETQAGFNTFTVVDGNEDGVSWQHQIPVPLLKRKGEAYYMWKPQQGDTPADDWLITPGIQLRANQKYTLSFLATTGGHTEKFEVRYGTAPNVASMLHLVISPRDVQSKSGETIKTSITPSADGVYYIGIHVISEPNRFRLAIDDIQLEAVSVATAPMAAENLSVIPDDSGLLRATISFDAPKKLKDGSPITSLSHIVVQRNNGELVKRYENPSPGEHFELIDTPTQNGDNTYTVIAFIGDVEGVPASQSAYIGVDVPLPPEGFKVSDEGDKVIITWQPLSAVGKTGKVVRPDDCLVHIFAFDDLGRKSELATLQGSDRRHTITLNTTEGMQRIEKWAFQTENVAGKSELSSCGVVMGLPVPLPFAESFPQAKMRYFWWLDYSDSASVWNPNGTRSSDGDEGSAEYAIKAGTWSTLYSSKVSMGTAQHYVIRLDLFAKVPNDLNLSIIRRRPNSEEEVLRSVQIAELSGVSDRWVSLDIPTETIPADAYEIHGFKVQSEQGGHLFVDNIRIEPVFDTDIEVELQPMSSVTKGQYATVPINVRNVGTRDISAFTVKLYVDGKVFFTQQYDTPLTPWGEVKQIVVERIPTSSLMRGSALPIKAEVSLEGDENETNNQSEGRLNLRTNLPKAPIHFTATQDKGQVILTWQATEGASRETVTEGFESYAPWAVNLGQWTTVKVDQNKVYVPYYYNFPYPAEGFAYVVFNPEQLNIDVSLDYRHAPHSGKQMLVSFVSEQSDEGVPQPCDHWLISPQLSGYAQTVSLFAAALSTSEGNEKMQLLYSQTDTKPESFVAVKSIEVDYSSGGVGKYSTPITLDVPEGTKFFAIRHYDAGTSALLVDDVTFERVGTPLVGYNLYRNGTLLTAIEGANTVSFTDTPQPEGAYTYHLTARYEDGSESEPATLTISTPNQRIVSPTEPVDIYTIDGKLIRQATTSIDDLAPGIYIVGNRKVIISPK